MTKEKIVEGSFLLAEIESLSDLKKMFEPHFNRKWMEEEEKIRAVSFFWN
jgi:hypothetical protein